MPETHSSLPKYSKEKKPISKKIKSTTGKIVGTILKTIFWSIFIFTLIQGIMIFSKMWAQHPNDRMCWEKSTCIKYCPAESLKFCEEKSIKINYDDLNVFELMITGKKNLLEILTDDQKYCQCKSQSDPSRPETFYEFYQSNN